MGMVAKVHVTFTVEVTVHTGLNEDASVKDIRDVGVKRAKELIEGGIERANAQLYDWHQRQQGEISSTIKIAQAEMLTVIGK